MQNYLNSSFGCILQFLSRKVNIYSSALFFLFLQIRTVKVSNISLAVTERDIKEFFSFSGDIQYVEMQRLALFSLKLPGNLLINLFEEVILKKVVFFAGRLKRLSLHMSPSRIHREQTQLCS